MPWTKASPALIARFDQVLPSDPRVERRVMFGFPAAFVAGHMFMGLHEERFVVRLADAARHDLLKLPGTRVFEPSEGRPLREYVVLPALVLDDEVALRRWVQRAFDYASGLPSKKPRAAKPAKPEPGA